MKTADGVVVQSLARALDILDCFSGYQAELGIKDIAQETGLGKSTVYGLVNTLAVHRYLEQDPESKRYRLGIELFKMGMLVHRRMDLGREARPYAQELSGKHKATSHIAALFHNAVIYVDKVDVPGAVILYSQVGRPAPCHSTGVGKAIAAFLPQQLREQLLAATALEAFTENTLTDPADIRREWALIRQRGYAVDNEEVEIGLRCVAAPIFGHEGLPVAGISVSAPVARLPQSGVQQAARDVKHAAAQISLRMGAKQ